MTTPSEHVTKAIVLMITNKGKPTVDEDTGQWVFTTGLHFEPEYPWWFFGSDDRMNCNLWKIVFYDFIADYDPELSCVASHCQNCYKVVVKPKTWKDFTELEEVFEGLGMPGKMGVEVRPKVKGLYGAYFYGRGLEEGRRNYKKIRKAVPDHIPVILKRGCTEMEGTVGPSDKWEVSPEQLEIEEELERRVRIDVIRREKTEEDKKRVHDYWQRFAYKFDYTYEGEELYSKPVTYTP